MHRVKVENIADIAPYDGPHKIPGIRFRAVREALGVRAWGMNVIELDPHCAGYPTHDHQEDGQEEVYLVVRGSAVLQAGDHAHQASEGDLVWVAPEVTRQWVTGDEGVVLLALGGTPGKAYPAG